MDQNNNYITIEMNVRVQMKDYRVVLGMRKAWMVAIAVAAVKLIAWALKATP